MAQKKNAAAVIDKKDEKPSSRKIKPVEKALESSEIESVSEKKTVEKATKKSCKPSADGVKSKRSSKKDSREVSIDLEKSAEPEAEVPDLQLPINFISFGEIEGDDVQVYIKQSVYQKIEKLANSDTEHELGSILVGNYTKALGRVSVVISDCIEAEYTDASASTLTFTHETWDYVHKEKDSKYPDDRIIGWQHTHPGYGIFLSNYDMFIQENFFNLPFQVAYVVDPIQNLRGFFQWKNGKVEKLHGYYIYDDPQKKIKFEQESAKEVKKTPAKKNSLAAVSLCLLAAALIGLGVLGTKYGALLKQNAELNTRLLERTAEAADSQKEIPVSGPDASALEEAERTIEDLNGTVEQKEAELEIADRKLAYVNSLLEKGERGFRITDDGYVEYTVRRGQTLGEICSICGVDFKANKEEIIEINNLKDINSIVVGQTIKLPLPFDD